MQIFRKNEEENSFDDMDAEETEATENRTENESRIDFLEITNEEMADFIV